MSRRRTKPVQTSKVSTVLNRVIGLTLLLLLAVGSFGLGTVYLRHQSATTANAIKSVERGIALEKRRLSELSAELTRLSSRDSLLALNTQHGLRLGIPGERQIVRVTENVEARLYRKSTSSLVTASRF